MLIVCFIFNIRLPIYKHVFFNPKQSPRILYLSIILESLKNTLILSSQRPSIDRSGLGFVKEMKLESFHVTNQEGSKKIYAGVLKTPAKKEGSKKAGLIFQDIYKSS